MIPQRMKPKDLVLGMKTRTEELEDLIQQTKVKIFHSEELLSHELMTAIEDLQRYTIELYECKKMSH